MPEILRSPNRWLCALAFCAVSLCADAATPVLGIKPEYLDADFWIERLDAADQVLLDATAIAELNASMRTADPSFHRLDALPPSLPAAEVERRIAAVSTSLPDDRFDTQGRKLSASDRRALRKMLALKHMGAEVEIQFGLVVRRAALRSYPTLQRLLNQADDQDIDRLQESALFPGDAVAILHRSQDRRWLFVVSERYAAWIESDAIAIGARNLALAYAQRAPALTVIGTQARTVYAPNAPARSQLVIDMGVRIPLRPDWSDEAAVDGQLPVAAWVIDLPQRDQHGQLMMTPALIARAEPVARAPLPFTQANIIRQAFRFLGERYGWGHDYQARDCSGFVSEVYRSLGILLPRNTRDQAISPVLDRIALDHAIDPAARERLLSSLQVGDLIYIPGHVMMTIGRIDGQLWVIHDVNGVNVLDQHNKLRHLSLNGVSVTPLKPLMADATTPLTARITNIQRVRLGTHHP